MRGRRRKEANIRRPPLGRWLRQARGVSTTEAVILIVLGVLVLLAGIQLFGGGIGHQYDSVTRTLSGGDDEADEQAAQQASARSDGEASRSDTSASDDGRGRGDGSDGTAHSGGGDRDGVAMGDATSEREEASGSVGGVNPLIILLIIGGVLAVGYLIYADDD